MILKEDYLKAMKTIADYVEQLQQSENVIISENENVYWDMINKLKWSAVGGYLYKEKGEWLKTNYSPEEIRQLQEFVKNKRSILVDKLTSIKTQWGTGDDGFWDLTAHIVGLGKDEYYNSLNNPIIVSERVTKSDYKENFQYIFQYSFEKTECVGKNI